MRRLRDLLLELFADPRPLRQHLRMDARTVVLLPNLPGEPASLSDVVHALVQQVVRDGLTRALIDGLCAAFPLRRGEIEAVGKAVTDAVPTSGAQADEEIVRYRRVMAAMYGSMRFIGIPRAANAPEQTLRDGFVPLALGRIGYQPHWTPVRLLCQLLRPWTNTLRIIALGDPGAGKTTLCRFLTTVLAGGIALEG